MGVSLSSGQERAPGQGCRGVPVAGARTSLTPKAPRYNPRALKVPLGECVIQRLHSTCPASPPGQPRFTRAVRVRGWPGQVGRRKGQPEAPGTHPQSGEWAPTRLPPTSAAPLVLAAGSPEDRRRWVRGPCDLPRQRLLSLASHTGPFLPVRTGTPAVSQHAPFCLAAGAEGARWPDGSHWEAGSHGESSWGCGVGAPHWPLPIRLPAHRVRAS